jgi:spermidine synthase
MKLRLRCAILVMGFSGLVAQIFLLCEFLIIFSGNEFSIGIILAHWLILEAFGAFYLGRMIERINHKLAAFTFVTLLFCLSFLCAIYLIRILKGTIGISIGENISFVPMFISSFLILAPVSILHGTLFTFSCHIYAGYTNQDESSAGRVYAYETVGMVIGGITCTYLIIPYLDTFQAASGLALLNSAACLALLAPDWKTGRYHKITLLITSTFCVLFLVLTGLADKLHSYSITRQWKNQEIVHYQNSQYGNICVIENEGQYIYFQDGVPNIITPIPDIPYVEQFVHLPLLAHPDPERLLILSGGAGGVIHEVLKHTTVETIEYAELDPLIINLIRKFPTRMTESELNDNKVTIKNIDGRLLLQRITNQYDLILIGVSEPSNLQTNRFYTQEFFSLAKESLNKNGILVIGLPGSLSYSTEELKNLNSSIYYTLNRIFPFIRVIPGYGINLFLLSGSPEILTLEKTQIIERLEQRKIKSEMFIPWHIEQTLHQGWQGWFQNFIEGSSQEINSDFKPIGVFYSISHWNSQFAPSMRWIFRQFDKISLGTISILLIIFLLLYWLFRSIKARAKRIDIPFAIFTTGFAGMIFDLMLIFAFQSIYGHVFSWIGLLVAAFMAGAAGGALLIASVITRIDHAKKMFNGIELGIMAFSLGCALIVFLPDAYLGNPGAYSAFRYIFLIVSFSGGLLIGAQFPLANKLYLGNETSVSRTAGLLYSADLLGGWVGGLLGAVVLLPILGLVSTCIAVGLLKLTSLIVINTQPNLYPSGG